MAQIKAQALALFSLGFFFSFLSLGRGGATSPHLLNSNSIKAMTTELRE